MSTFGTTERLFWPGQSCVIVGEVGQSHDGSLGTAHAFIDAIANAGADAVKFQTHNAVAESTTSEPWRIKFSVQDATRYDYWKRMEFTEEQWCGLKRHAQERGLKFLSSPFSFDAVDLLSRIGVSAWKVPSGETGNTPMLDRMIATGLPIMLSTGMSPLSEIDSAVELVKSRGVPLILLQCTTAYPCPPEEVGLNVIPFFRERYGCAVGLSDHSGTIYAGLAAVTLGIQVLEVHVTLSREMFGPDVRASITTTELRQLVEGIRFIEKIKRNPVNKDQVARDLGALRNMFRKSVVTRGNLMAGTVLREEDLTVKKPGTGIPAKRLPEVVGRRLKRPVTADTLLSEEDFTSDENSGLHETSPLIPRSKNSKPIQILNAEPLGYSQEARSILAECGTLLEKEISRSELLSELGDYDVLIVRLAHHIDQEIIEAGRRLKVIVTATTGLDHIDVEYAQRRGITILSLRDETDFLRGVSATGEHTWALLLSLLRRIVPASVAARRGEWKRDAFRGHELDGKRLGIIGLGRIGGKVARYGQAFGMEVSAYDPTAQDWMDGVWRAPSLAELLRSSDVLSLHVPLTVETEGMIGATELALLPLGAVLVNTSRGQLLDEAALVQALENGRLAGAAVDVVCHELDGGRRSNSSVLKYASRLDNLLITPHIGGATYESMARTEVFMARKLKNFLSSRGFLNHCEVGTPRVHA